jgi:hypothetical protein
VSQNHFQFSIRHAVLMKETQMKQTQTPFHQSQFRYECSQLGFTTIQTYKLEQQLQQHFTPLPIKLQVWMQCWITPQIPLLAWILPEQQFLEVLEFSTSLTRVTAIAILLEEQGLIPLTVLEFLEGALLELILSEQTKHFKRTRQ